MSRILPLLTVLVACTLAACGDDENKVQILVFQASPDAIEAGQSTKLVFAVQPASAKVSINGLGDVTGKTEASVSPTETTSYQLTASFGKATTNETVRVTVGATSAASIKIQPSSKTPTAGEPFTVALTVLGTDGNVAPGFRGTLHIASTDTSAALPQDIAFTATEAGTKTVNVTLKTAGGSTLTATDVTGKANASGAAVVTVQPAAAQAYQLVSDLPSSAAAGDALKLTIAVHDAFGNLATPYGGKIHLASTDSNAMLPPDSAFTAGVQTVLVTFTTAGNRVVTIEDVAGSLPATSTATVAVGPAIPSRLVLSTPSTATTAGATQPVTVTVTDRFGNPSTNYTGTVHFTATDASAVLPGDFTFSPGDAGRHDFTITLKIAGSTTVTAADGALGVLTDSKVLTVGAGDATTCIASRAPTAAPAGTVVGLIVAVRDAFGNTANGYAGTIALTATDARANLPGAVTYVPASDAGSHPFSVVLLTTGAQTVTATDVTNPAIACTLGIAITPAAPKLVVTLPSDTNSGFPANVGVAVKDLFDNAIPNFAGTVSFTSTDTGAGAAPPGDLTFTGTENGVATTTATFVTLGAQTLSGTATGTAQFAGSAVARVHGLVYTAPDTGKVRLVANAAKSNAQIIQLDLVASERLTVSSFFGGPGPFSTGMNLPLDTTRVGAGSPLFTPGQALPAGTGVPAAAGVLGNDHVLYTAVSRKRTVNPADGSNPVAIQDTQVNAGDVFYSVKLKLTQNGAPGTVFDGAQPMAAFRAAVRDQFGDDFVGQSDFGIGKLEIR
jgi:hypothetical protein